MKSDLIQEELQPGGVQLWIADQRDWMPNIGGILQYLSENEIQRSHRLVIQEKKDQYLLSRGLLRLILSSYLGTPAGLIEFSTNPSGKPYLKDSNLSFNISHSKNLMVFGFCLESNIGVDIQETYSISNPDIIIRKTFSLEEKIFLENLPSIKQRDIFFAIWTAKEAYLKALGDGFHESPTEISTIPALLSKDFTLDHPSRNNFKSPWTIQSVETDSGYMAAFAVNQDISRLEMLRYKPIGDTYCLVK